MNFFTPTGYKRPAYIFNRFVTSSFKLVSFSAFREKKIITRVSFAFVLLVPIFFLAGPGGFLNTENFRYFKIIGNTIYRDKANLSLAEVGVYQR